MTEFEQAQKYMIDAHESIGQIRKYGDEAYYHHTDRVSLIVQEVGGTKEMIFGAKFHDILEDVTPKNPLFGPDGILRMFGAEVLKYTFECTDIFTKEAFPNYNRALRKAFETARLATISDEAKIIKMADIVDNSRDLDNIKGFSQVWVKEKVVILKVLRPTGDRWMEAYETLLARCGKIK